MSKTFAETFEDACYRLGGNNSHLKMEKDRIHREAVRDQHHAFRNVDIIRPDPWKNRTGLSL